MDLGVIGEESHSETSTWDNDSNTSCSDESFHGDLTTGSRKIILDGDPFPINQQNSPKKDTTILDDDEIKRDHRETTGSRSQRTTLSSTSSESPQIAEKVTKHSSSSRQRIKSNGESQKSQSTSRHKDVSTASSRENGSSRRYLRRSDKDEKQQRQQNMNEIESNDNRRNVSASLNSKPDADSGRSRKSHGRHNSNTANEKQPIKAPVSQARIRTEKAPDRKHRPDTTTNLKEVLANLRLSHYEHEFFEQGIMSTNDLINLTGVELKDNIGIRKLGERKRILKYAEEQKSFLSKSANNGNEKIVSTKSKTSSARLVPRQLIREHSTVSMLEERFDNERQKTVEELKENKNSTNIHSEMPSEIVKKLPTDSSNLPNSRRGSIESCVSDITTDIVSECTEGGASGSSEEAPKEISQNKKFTTRNLDRQVNSPKLNGKPQMEQVTNENLLDDLVSKELGQDHRYLDTSGDFDDSEERKRNRQEIFRALHQLCFKAQSASDRKEDNNSSFSFSLLSARPETLKEYFSVREENYTVEGGSRFLDAFRVEKIDVLQSFPETQDTSTIDALRSFCFPHGLGVRLIPICAIEGAKRFGWLGNKGDDCQRRKFVDRSGEVKRSITITVWEELPSTNSQTFGIVACLARCREQQVAAYRISKCWRQYRTREKKKTTPKKKNFWNLDLNNSGKKKSFWPRKAGKGRDSEEFMGWNDSGHDEEGYLTGQHNLPEVVLERASEAYKNMIKNERLGDLCIMEKCYIVTGINPEDENTILSFFKEMIDLDREGKTLDGLLRKINSKLNLKNAPTSKGVSERQHLKDKEVGGSGVTPVLTQPSHLKSDRCVSDAHRGCKQRLGSKNVSERTATEGGKVRIEETNKPVAKAGKARRNLRKEPSVRTLQSTGKVKKVRGREAVIAQKFGTDYVKKVIPKSEAVSKLIYDAIKYNILFKACCEEELHEVIDVFEESNAHAGSVIIKQGDEGEKAQKFYVMERGTVDVYVDDTHVSVLYAGKAFGEIALLYGCPRSATLRARYDCKLWWIDRQAFHFITSQYKKKRLEMKAALMKKVKIEDKILGEVLKPSEIQAMAQAAQNISYASGETIIKQGEQGDIFYVIESGSVDVFIKEKGDKPLVTLTDGKFFGEKALLSNDVRSASCVAATPTKCIFLMREDFTLMLGDLKDLLLRANDHDRADRHSLIEGDIPNTGPKRGNFDSLQLDDLEERYTLGEGAFGVVKLVKVTREIPEMEKDTEYALKCMSKKKIDEHNIAEKVMSEKNVMGLIDHPFIVRFFCALEDTENLYFLLEALVGGELFDLLQERTKLPEEWSKFYSASVLYGFCHMHSRKIAYRDLKPENLVLDARGYVKIVDLGLAKQITSGKTWTFCGTPDYMAPELILNEGHDWAVDYWGLGILLFEIIEGSTPFYSENQMEQYQMILAGDVTMPSHVSDDLGDLIRKLLNISQSKRFGKTMGGGGAVMQHRFFSDLDWDALLEKKLDPPFVPDLDHHDDSSTITSDEKDRQRGNSIAGERGGSIFADGNFKMQQSETKKEDSADSPELGVGFASQKRGEHRISYALGQGNRHHQKMLEMLGHSSLGQQQNTKKSNRITLIEAMQKMPNVSQDNFARGPERNRVGAPSIQEENDQDSSDDDRITGAAELVRRGYMNKESSFKEHFKKSRSWKHSGEHEDSDEDDFNFDKAPSFVKKPVQRKKGKRRGTVAEAFMADGENNAQLSIQLMNLAVMAKADRQVREKIAFESFSLLSLKAKTLLKEFSLNQGVDFSLEGGSRYLDPFSFDQIELIDQFPASYGSEVDALAPEALSPFCFPNGLKLRLIPRCAVQGAARIGWLGPKGDRYQLHVFTDVSGNLSHGIAITTLEMLPSSSRHTVSIIADLVCCRRKRRAALIIQRCWRQYQASSMFSGNMNSSIRSGISNNFWGSRANIEDSSFGSSNHSARGMMKRGRHHSEVGKKLWDVVKNLSNHKHSSLPDLEGDLLDDGDLLGWEEEDLDWKRKPSKVVQHLAKEAWLAMAENDRLGDICVVEKCYVLLGTKPEEQSLLFAALQEIIDVEREDTSIGRGLTRSSSQQSLDAEENSPGTSLNMKSSHEPHKVNRFKDKRLCRSSRGERSNHSFVFSQNRHTLLMTMQNKLCLSKEQARVTFPKSELDHIRYQQAMFELDLPIGAFKKITLPLPLPHVSDQWGFATLLLRIKITELLVLVKLLLLERSVLILGNSFEEVTSCGCALLDLLKPYKWASTFMPLLPPDLIDFVSSPVPFITGMVAENNKHLDEIENDHRVKEATLQDGLSILNLSTGKLLIPSTDHTAEMLKKSFTPTPQFFFCQARMEQLAKNKKSSIHSFRTFFQYGLSRKECLTLQLARNLILEHITSLSGELSTTPECWRQYLEFNKHTQGYEFCPDMFVKPLREQLIHKLQFQEMLAHTQLFVGFVEELKNDNEKQIKLCDGTSGLFIAEWLSYQWPRYKRRTRLSS